MTRVIKIGGRTQNEERLFKAISEAWTAAPGSLCVIHGGGDDVSTLQRAMGREAVFVGGRRVTSQGDLELLRMVLSGVVNKKLVSRFQAIGVPALGLSGEDGGLIEAEIIDASTLGFAGRPRAVNASLLRTIMDAGYMPVISPVSYNSSNVKSMNGALNVNGDDAATAVAIALEADELLLVSDVKGVRLQGGEFAPSLTSEQARELIDSGIATGGMAAKLESAGSALAAGVERVRICDPEGISSVGKGTTFTQSAGIVS